jgi:multimeric flavodoxin WrbA
VTEPRKLLILVGSPRRAGNSATLARAVQRGAEATDAQIALRHIPSDSYEITDAE